MHYYQFNIGDYSRRTKYLDLFEDLAYRRLLDLYYLQEAPFTESADLIARKIGMKDHADAVSFVLCEFFPDGKNKHADQEIAKYKEKSDKAKKAIETRWKKAYECNTDVIRTNNESNSDHIPTNNQEPITNNNIHSESQANSPTAKQVMDLWNKVMEGTYARQKKVFSAATVRRINTLTKNEFESLDDWSIFFNKLTESDFLMGKISSPNRKAFQLSLEWAIKESNLIKIIEGAYHG